MDPELFLLEMSETLECQSIMYKRMAINMFIGLYYSNIQDANHIDAFMIPFRERIKKELQTSALNYDELIMYMLNNDKSGCTQFLVSTRFSRKSDISYMDFLTVIQDRNAISPYVVEMNLDVILLIIISFVFDNLQPSRLDIADIVNDEVFIYPTNQYCLTNVTGATFKKDGLLFNGKGYYYNIFTNKTMLHPLDSSVGFAKIIQDDAGLCDVLYRLDERLSMPEDEYEDYTGVAFAKFYGPQFKFDGRVLSNPKTLIVHIDEKTQSKLLMVIKKDFDTNVSEEFWHLEIETLPYPSNKLDYVTTTFLHGMYYPRRKIFTHIDYTKNRYGKEEYFEKYIDSTDGAPIDTYTASRDLHYKIWCIENGEFTIETWYKLMIVSLPPKYQVLLNEILDC